MSQPFQHNSYDSYDQDGLPTAPPYQAQAPMYQPQAPAFQQPPVYQQQFVMMSAQIEQKSWVITVILAFFLGMLGVHNFYLGYTGRGVAQLVLTVLGWFTAIILIGFALLIIVGLWVLVEFILILLRSGSMSQDSRGIPLK